MVAINIDGTIKTFSKLPKTWGRILNYDKANSDVHYKDGFREVTEPVIDPATQYKGVIYYDSTSDVFTYQVLSKTPEQLEDEKIQKQKAAKEKIKQEKIDKYVEEQVNLDPVANKDYYPLWTEGTYQIGDKRQYKEKLFENGLADNINAPDKGGWTELK